MEQIVEGLIVLFIAELVRRYHEDVWDWFYAAWTTIRRRYYLRYPKPVGIKHWGTMTMGRCAVNNGVCISPNGEKPVTQVLTESGERLNVCNPCLDSQFKNKRWIRLNDDVE